MKTLIAVTLFTLCTATFAATEVDVISSEVGVEDNFHRKSLCLTIVREPLHGKLLGLVEDIGDCFYARQAQFMDSNRMELDLKQLRRINHRGLRRHLQKRDQQLRFYFIDGE